MTGWDPSLRVLLLGTQLALIAVALTVSGAAGAERGYVSRPCGFDMNRNGVIGEVADCNVCDGSTADPDGDGVAEDLIYIDCQAGTNSASCGAPGSPCRTITYAWDNRADGPGDGAEDILCFRGTCRETWIPTAVNGLVGTYTLPRSGSQARDFQLPRNPTMLVGWDADNDGAYPSYDAGDVAVLDGSGASFDYALEVARSRVEIAHFTARAYGRDGSGANSGFAGWGTSGPLSHIYFHDLSLQDINRGREAGSGQVTLSMWAPRVNHVAYVNLEVLNYGGYLVRGVGPADGVNVSGPLRYQNLTVTGRGCPESSCGSLDSYLTGFKVWNWIQGVEVLDSVWNAQPALWDAGNSVVFKPAQCSRDWVIRNNEIIDYQNALVVQASAGGACEGSEARTVDDVVFDANLVRQTYDWTFDNFVLISDPGPTAATTAEDVTISNNIFHSTAGNQGILYALGSNSYVNPGTITIVNNTFSSDIDREVFAALYLMDGGNFHHQSWVIKNNIFTGLGPDDLNVNAEFAPVGWNADYNVFDSDADFLWNGNFYGTLSQWRTTSGGDANSRTCWSTVAP